MDIQSKIKAHLPSNDIYGEDEFIMVGISAGDFSVKAIYNSLCNVNINSMDILWKNI